MVQAHRFAGPELDATVRQIWKDGIKNSEVRELLLELIGSGKLMKCADIAYSVAMDKKASQRERLEALDALIELEDQRLSKISWSIEVKAVLWPAPLARSAIPRLFPTHLDVKRLCILLERLKASERVTDELNWSLPKVIEKCSLTQVGLDDLRVGLTSLIVDATEWHIQEWPHTQTKRSDLISALMTVCNRQFRANVRAPQLFRSSVIALRLAKEQTSDEFANELNRHLTNASTTEREQVFWADDAFLARLHPAEDAWQRLFQVGHHGGMTLNPEKDRPWVIRSLADTSKAISEREMMLWAAMVFVKPPGESHVKTLEDLKSYVADASRLLTILDERLKPSPGNEEALRLQEESKKHKEDKQTRDAEAHATSCRTCCTI